MYIISLISPRCIHSLTKKKLIHC